MRTYISDELVTALSVKIIWLSVSYVIMKLSVVNRGPRGWINLLLE
jgi:hypothetical protein